MDSTTCLGPTRCHLKGAYRFPGFTPSVHLEPHPVDDAAWVLSLRRRGKNQSLRMLWASGPWLV
ncbi:MAG: hypothetical protein H6686_11350 [Fibrobacteria bacterium]|nr:hypothetical protein [Fibrobacteria bacterium]